MGVVEVALQDPVQVLLTEDNDVIGAPLTQRRKARVVDGFLGKNRPNLDGNGATDNDGLSRQEAWPEGAGHA